MYDKLCITTLNVIYRVYFVPNTFVKYFERQQVALHPSHRQNESSFNGRFGPYIDDLQNWASWVDQIPLGIGRFVCPFPLHQIHKDAFSACTPISCMIFFLYLPVTSSLPSALNDACAGKTRHPSSTGKHHVFHSLSWQCSTNYWYFSCLRS